MEEELQNLLRLFNQSYKEQDILYHDYARHAGLPDSVFWILYCLAEQDRPCTQRELCSAWSFPPQTVNSSLKAMEARGVIVLECVPGNRKNKRIRLTEAGEELTRRVISPLMQAERDSFAALEPQELEALLTLTRKYVALLREHVSGLTQA